MAKTPYNFNNPDPKPRPPARHEHVQAANALIEWFNSQDIAKPDAMVIMGKVMAKIIVGKSQNPFTVGEDFQRLIETYADEIVVRLHQVR